MMQVENYKTISDIPMNKEIHSLPHSAEVRTIRRDFKSSLCNVILTNNLYVREKNQDLKLEAHKEEFELSVDKSTNLVNLSSSSNNDCAVPPSVLQKSTLPMEKTNYTVASHSVSISPPISVNTAINNEFGTPSPVHCHPQLKEGNLGHGVRPSILLHGASHLWDIRVEGETPSSLSE
ncbi:hypothetical protein LguiA_026121 [Lonicera macranthoides]